MLLDVIDAEPAIMTSRLGIAITYIAPDLILSTITQIDTWSLHL
jgi:hypothetical protein